MGIDHTVPFKSEQDIAAIAARCWRASKQKRPFAFDAKAFIEDVLVARGIDEVTRSPRGKHKGKLAVEFFDREFSQEDPAFVVFDPSKRESYVTLHVARQVWADAEKGESYALEILAHEIGHILLHDHYSNAFSSDLQAQKTLEGKTKEDFAEWQAITFAGHLLVPTYVAQKFFDPTILAAATNAPDRVVKKRLLDLERIKAPLKRNYEGDACANCNNFTLVMEDCSRRCDTCGNYSSIL